MPVCRALTTGACAAWLTVTGCSDRELLGRLPRAITGTADSGASMGTADASTDGGQQGGSAYRGNVILTEHFNDAAFASRGWIDVPAGTISTAEHAQGSQSSFECQFTIGNVTCANGRPGRFLFDGVRAIYAAYWAKYSQDFVAATDIYFQTNIDPAVCDPKTTHFFTNLFNDGGYFSVELTDNANIDTSCLRLTDGSTMGCNGQTVETYPFTEARSVNACNGVLGDPDQASCYTVDLSPTGYKSARAWRSKGQVLDDSTGPRAKTAWHFIEQYFALNDVEGGIGVPNGAIRFWVDGQLIVEKTGLLLRTGRYPDMLLTELLFAPWASSGAVTDQRLWIDELVVAEGRR